MPIPNGTSLHIYWEDVSSNGNSWGYTDYFGMYGWVALTQVSNKTESSTDTIPVKYRVIVKAPDGGVNFRSGPGTEYPTLISYMIPNDVTLQVTSETKSSNGGFWGQVTYDGKTGWITMQQVDPIEEYSGSTSSYSTDYLGDQEELITTVHTASAVKEQSVAAAYAAADENAINPSLLLTLVIFAAAVLASAGAAGYFLYRRRK